MSAATKVGTGGCPKATAPEAPPLPGRSSAAFTIGRAEPSDLPEIVGLLLRAVPHCVPQTIDQLWSREDSIWVARNPSGDVVASASLVPVTNRRLELRSVVVDPSVRGLGVGRALVAHLIGQRAASNREVCCVTRTPQFFSQLGFEPLGTPWEVGEESCRSRERIAMHRDPVGMDAR